MNAPDDAAAPLPPLSLYIHIPWCVRKCPYCDFNSHGLRQTLPEADYIAALIADLDAALPRIAGRSLISIFFGGGTPSLFSGAGIDAILNAVRVRIPLSPDAEITLEANPGTAETEKFAAFRAAGVNRLSLGIQSFNPAHLRALGRIHDEREAHRAIEIAMRCFDTVNLDLMYGLPGQMLDQARDDLGQALAFAPAHLSCYQLTIEPDTAFAARPPSLDPDLGADMQEAIEARLTEAGYQYYETSAFARPGRQCRHNLNYWTFGDYLGIGAGAHSKLTLPSDIAAPRPAGASHAPQTPQNRRIIRQRRWAQPVRYIAQAAAGCACQEEIAVGSDELPGEFMMNALRLNQGFDAALFTERTSLPLERIAAPLQRARAEGLIEWTNAPDIPDHINGPAAQTAAENWQTAPGASAAPAENGMSPVPSGKQATPGAQTRSAQGKTAPNTRTVQTKEKTTSNARDALPKERTPPNARTASVEEQAAQHIPTAQATYASHAATETHPAHITPTPRGRRFLNRLLALFLP